jgi:hypothetical protein
VASSATVTNVLILDIVILLAWIDPGAIVQAYRDGVQQDSFMPASVAIAVAGPLRC